MSVNILILTHEHIGESMLNTAKRILGPLPLNIFTLSAGYECCPARVIKKVEKLIAETQTKAGTLILTDMYGATPSNIAQHFNCCNSIRLISGLNLPMLMRTLNYSELNLDQICDKAYYGGQAGIILCESN